MTRWKDSNLKGDKAERQRVRSSLSAFNKMKFSDLSGTSLRSHRRDWSDKVADDTYTGTFEQYIAELTCDKYAYAKDTVPVHSAEGKAILDKIGRWSDGSPIKVDDDGIIQDTSFADTEAKRGVEAWENDEVFDFDAQSVYFREAYKDAWFETTRPPNYGDYVDQYFDEHLTELHWRFKEQEAKRLNSLLQMDDRPSVPVNEFVASGRELAVAVLIFLMFATLGYVTTRKGDAAAADTVRFLEVKR